KATYEYRARTSHARPWPQRAPNTSSERRTHREPELPLLLRLQVVVEHVAPRRIHRKNQPERHVQHRHEEADFRSGRRLERIRFADDVRPDRQLYPSQWIRDYTNGVDERRIQRARRRPEEYRLLPREMLADVAHLPGIEEQHQTHRAGDVNQVFGIEQEALVAADRNAGDFIARGHRPDVETADAVLATQENLLEDRQHPGVAVRTQVFPRRSESER